jgi:hypothetical protein
MMPYILPKYSNNCNVGGGTSDGFCEERDRNHGHS